MDNYLLEKILRSLRSTRPYFQGVYPCDWLKMPTLFPAQMVVNLDDSERKGRHWVALHMPNAGEAYYFDSFGEPPDGDIEEFLRTNKIDLIYSPFPIQSLISKVCGGYCIYFLHECAKRRRYEDILAELNRKHNPDAYIVSFTNALIE